MDTPLDWFIVLRPTAKRVAMVTESSNYRRNFRHASTHACMHARTHTNTYTHTHIHIKNDITHHGLASLSYICMVNYPVQRIVICKPLLWELEVSLTY